MTRRAKTEKDYKNQKKGQTKSIVEKFEEILINGELPEYIFRWWKASSEKSEKKHYGSPSERKTETS